jgi:hypothetical protein
MFAKQEWRSEEHMHFAREKNKETTIQAFNWSCSRRSPCCDFEQTPSPLKDNCAQINISSCQPYSPPGLCVSD